MVRSAFAATALDALALLARVPAQAAPHGTVIVQPGHQAPVSAQGRQACIPAPPPPGQKAHPRARRGQVWVEGHWQWRGKRPVWAPGHWVQARSGQRYRQAAWAERDGQWRLRGGGRNRDRDGVPNRCDRRPGNAYRHWRARTRVQGALAGGSLTR